MSSILTLEPLLEAIRTGLKNEGWTLSGLQKTTSHQFEGRWEGESSRSAYVFFHRGDLPDGISVDVFLDESAKGLRGNLALVVEGPVLGKAEDVRGTLTALSKAAGSILPEGYRRPISMRLHLENPDVSPEEAASEYRFKLQIPNAALDAGANAVVAMTTACVSAFEALLGDERLKRHLPRD